MSTVTRLDQTFAALKAQGRKALIPFITCGDPFPEKTVDLMLAMAEAGADVIELGVPFSDPMADGPVIQRAAERALVKGISLTRVLADVKAFRAQNASTPVVLMGYANPIEAYDQHHGAGSFVRDAKASGVDGVLVVDYPPEECQDFAAALKAHGMDMIFLLAPTSSDARIQEIAQIASGYVYYVSLKGVTGSAALDTDDVARMLARIQQHVHIPVGVGFGIRDGQTAHTVAQMADAVIIGSRIIQLLEDQPHEKVIPLAIDFLRGIRKAMDA